MPGPADRPPCLRPNQSLPSEHGIGSTHRAQALLRLAAPASMCLATTHLNQAPPRLPNQSVADRSLPCWIPPLSSTPAIPFTRPAVTPANLASPCLPLRIMPPMQDHSLPKRILWSAWLRSRTSLSRWRRPRRNIWIYRSVGSVDCPEDADQFTQFLVFHFKVVEFPHGLI